MPGWPSVSRPVLLTMLFAAAAPMCAYAALGGNTASVLRDHELLQMSHSVTPTERYDLHEGRTADGVRLREYVDRSGNVFAVGWEGPRSPAIGTLLGNFADRYYAAARARRGNHHVLAVRDPDFVVTVVRLPRGWQGQAYLPDAIPPGVTVAELR